MSLRRIRIKAPDFMFMHGRSPIWKDAYVDRGGTDVFGPGPYLKLPCTGDEGDMDDITVHRVRPPGGYANQTVKVEQDADGVWWWNIEKPKTGTLL